MAGSVKRTLQKVLENARLTNDELLIILLEIEGTINSRPLTYEYDGVGGEMLTSPHLLYGFRLLSLPGAVPLEGDKEHESSMSERFQYLGKVRTHVWNRWECEYLIDLREYHIGKHETQLRTVSVRDVVIAHEENVKRGLWKI